MGAVIPKKRIASLLASATEMVVALGLEDQLVAISHECDYPARVLDRPRLSRPRFDPTGLDSGAIDKAVRAAMGEHGSVYAVDGEALERVQPELILTQAVCEVCAVPTPGVERVVAEHGVNAEVLSLDAHTIDEIFASMHAVARAAGRADAAERVTGRLRARIQRVREAVRGVERPRVLALEWLDPPFAPGHWVPEMIHLAGGRNLAGEAGEHSREISWGDIARIDPDVLVIMPCGYGLDAALTDADRHAEQLRTVASGAIEGERAFAVDGSSYFNRSGPRVVDGVEILAGLLHPARFGAPSSTSARAWRPDALSHSSSVTGQ